jgi:hypothetical protein
MAHVIHARCDQIELYGASLPGDNAIYNAIKDIEWIKNYQFPKKSDALGDVKMTVSVINADKLNKLWGCNQGMAFLRNKFLLKVTDKIYLLLNVNLLIDKMYQGMKFDFFRSVKDHNLLTKEG